MSKMESVLSVQKWFYRFLFFIFPGICAPLHFSCPVLWKPLPQIVVWASERKKKQQK